jgi:hypothetical protein
MQSLPEAVRLAALSLLLFGALGGAEPTFYAERVAPILERHCSVCHGAEKQKAKLRLDSFERVMRGSDTGVVVKPGDVKGSELFRRISLPHDDDEVMPSDGKPLLSADDIKIIELWIAAGASATKVVAEFPTAPAPKAAAPKAMPLAPDWHPRAAEIAALENSTGLKLLPRSQLATDGLVVRTASAPGRCDDEALAKLAPIGPFIVEAELARTKVTDSGLKSLSGWINLRRLDLTQTSVSSLGMAELTGLKNLETLNLTDTAVDEAGVDRVKALPALRQVWSFGTMAAEAAALPPAHAPK